MDETSCELESPSLAWPIHRVRGGSREIMDDRVVLEEPLEIVINGRRIAILMRLPGNEKELAAGYSVSEGYVRSAANIMLIHHCGLGHPAPVESEQDALGSRNR